MSARPTPEVPGKVLVTGAGGFIGKALSARLRELGAQVVGIDLNADEANGVVQGSTTDPGPWAHLLDDVDAVIHTAAVVSNVAPYDAAWEVNVVGTRRVLEAAAAAGVGRFVHLSSVIAYGFDFPDGVDETYPVRVTGKSTYGDTKVNSEAVVLAAHAAGEIDVTVIRPTDVYGPGSVWVREPIAMVKAGQLVLPDGGDGVFHIAYIDNFVDGMMLALASDAAVGQVFTIGDAAPVTCGEYFGRIAELAGGKVRTMSSRLAYPLLDAVGGTQRRLGRRSELSSATLRMLNRPGGYSIDKARDVLGYEPLVDFREGMRRTGEWAREQGLV
ncbi:NAD-dependent epimerase/dehydratase family protein [Streptomyces ipomoeae]|uniref:NAD-dependent epimerase/dehydratase family protein n=1 Tax=Streptomyces ipomoeae TaxID=103232 RepID=UPI001146C498|nr:NAD(P)-dependent oxidoreductase [Streptomyces ipomoeae]MDX2935525.1 NAD(P)-dependent oxidoreductase [Streptomyces ipomoeae]TQE18353.1 NAD(P)-dependent oxidoreductase [Streptomyces ipomoeae]